MLHVITQYTDNHWKVETLCGAKKHKLDIFTLLLPGYFSSPDLCYKTVLRELGHPAIYPQELNASPNPLMTL